MAMAATFKPCGSSSCIVRTASCYTSICRTSISNCRSNKFMGKNTFIPPRDNVENPASVPLIFHSKGFVGRNSDSAFRQTTHRIFRHPIAKFSRPIFHIFQLSVRRNAFTIYRWCNTLSHSTDCAVRSLPCDSSCDRLVSGYIDVSHGTLESLALFA
jgi:hypothetical protein